MRRWWRSRFVRVARLELGTQLRRPLFFMLVLVVVAATWGVATGHMRISSGDASVGGKQAWITSEYSNALLFCYLTMLFYAFFVAVAAGTTLVHDDDLRVGEVIHTTGLRPRQYVWGKFVGNTLAFLLVLAVQVIVTMLCEHVLPIDDADKIRGPFAVSHFVRPALAFAVPVIVFIAAISFALGERTRRPVLVFLFPVAVVMSCLFFFWDWDPEWLDPRINRLLMWLDPTGYRWLNETHIKVDRGVDYYNTQPVRWDGAFAISRVLLVALSLGFVAGAERRFARLIRGTHRLKAGAAAAATAGANAASALAPAVRALAGLGMRVTARSGAAQTLTVARFEFRNLLASAGLYLFVPLILLQTIVDALYMEGAWGTRLIVTSGTFAVGTFHTLTLCGALLLMFYTVESLDRESASRLAPIYGSTPVRTLSVFLGKAIANCFVGFVILAGAGLGGLVAMLVQGRTLPYPWPFVLVWGALLVPTWFFWTSFVIAVQSLLRNKFTTYGIALGILVLSGVLQARDKMNWVWNWNLWGTLRWTDFGLFEPNAQPLLWNRLLYITAGVFWLVLAVRWSARREHDSTRIVHRLAPARLLRSALPLLPYAVVPLVLAIGLGVLVRGGFQSKQARKAQRDYWKQNLATWRDAPKPGVGGVDLRVSLDPASHHFHSRGTYALVNDEEKPLRQFALTVGRHVGKVQWTLAGTAYEAEDRSHLFVFTPAAPLVPGDTLRVGFDFEGRWPDGITRNGGGLGEFIQPSGAVLTVFTPSFLPTIGWDEGIGVDPKENRYEPKRYPADYWKSRVKPGFGLERPFPTRIELDAPEAYTLNSVGVLDHERVEGGRRYATWVSDVPVNIFNVVAGKWDVRRGEGTAIYHHPAHTYNLDEMIRALDASRRYYSEWFAPYPWRELKVSEFANLATYAQGFGTNITFSEGIGFTALSDAHSRIAFMVTAHEAAHQWWGNLLVPGDGPGGDILSEGMAHFSTLLLTEQMLGPQGRIEFAKRIEERYGTRRHLDAERPLVEIDGSKDGDQTVTYDKGGWVFWMLLNLMGRDANLAGCRAFLANHRTNPDHPLLQDFVAELRPFAPDSTAFDAFTKQWFFEVAVPQYQFEDVKRVQEGTGWVVTGALHNIGGAQMPVEVAVTRGTRFKKQTEAEAAAGPAETSPEYHDARTTVQLGAGQTVPFRIASEFEPELVAADPDAKVLQLKRKYALHRF